MVSPEEDGFVENRILIESAFNPRLSDNGGNEKGTYVGIRGF